jgi:hypothetical protein
MLWTVFEFFVVVWMLRMVLHFGASAIPVVLVASLAVMLLRLVVRRTSFSRSARRASHEDRKVQLHHS